MTKNWSNVGNGVYLIDTVGPYFPRTIASYLVRSERGWVLFDTGYSSSAHHVLRAIREVGVGPGELRLVVVTHAHLDHCGALAEVLERHPKAKALVHEKAYRYMVDPERLLESVRALFGEENFRRMGGMRGVSEERVEVVDDGAELPLGDRTLRIFYTPGHAPHHLSVSIDPQRYVVTGDAVAHRSPLFPRPVPPTVPPRFDLDSYLRSLRRIFEHEPRLLLRPHYGPGTTPEGALEDEVEVVTRWMERVRDLKRESADPISIGWRILDEDFGGRDNVVSYARDVVRVFVLGAYLSL
ncbi:MAG: MBL fold metallo-hydrolase [Candidatus Caldarchaeales archaeon]